MSDTSSPEPRRGSNDLHLPDALRGPLRAHMQELRQAYLRRGWAGRAGFGAKPALLVIDLARYWLDPGQQIGSHLGSVVEAVCQLLQTARAANIPIFFTSFAYDPAFPPSPHDGKLMMKLPDSIGQLFDLDPRLERRPTEPIIRKRFASAFKGTPLYEMLAGLGIDTLIVTGVSTSHCVYASCRDATDHFRVIVPREAVGERCELMHEVFLLDIDIDLADVMPLSEVVQALKKVPKEANRA
jgi:nicotinamidase-related amidase